MLLPALSALAYPEPARDGALLTLCAAGGVVLSAQLRWGTRSAAAAAMAACLAASLLDAAPADTLAIGSGLFVAAAAAGAVFSLFSGRAELPQPRDVGLLAALSVVLVVLIPFGLLSLVRPGPSAGASGFAPSIAIASLATLMVALPMLSVTASPRPHGTLRPWPSLAAALVIAAALAAAGIVLARGQAVLALGITIGSSALLPLVVARAGLGAAALAVAVGSFVLNAAAARPATTPDWRTAFVLVCAAMLATVLVAHLLVASQRRREWRWETALEGSRLGASEWRVAGRRAWASPLWNVLHGRRDGPWHPRSWSLEVHPEDRQRVDEALRSVTTGEAGRCELEYRTAADSGDWRWLHTTLLVAERDGDGRPLRLLATASDIAALHDARARERLSASLFQHLNEGLLITDSELRVIDANPAYVAILGVPLDELVGTVPSLLRPSPADPVARQQRAAMWASLRATGSWRGELLDRHRDGEPRTLQATISTIGDDSGTPRYHALVLSDITEQRRQHDRLERQAHFDELTRLPNRARFDELLAEARAAADRDGHLLVVCYLDLDRFKPVNDRFGHAAGDRLLVELAGRLRSTLRSRDQWADCAARIGGDEFVLLLRAGTMEEARLAVERVLRVIAQPYLLQPDVDPVTVTASLGATVYPIDRSDGETLVRHADHAMYGAKQSGRNGYLFFDPEHRRRTEERVMAIGRVQEALDRDEFVLHYQPQVEMRSGRVVGLEALLRWEHPVHGLLSPLQFLSYIQNTGLTARIGDWALAEALERLALWRRQGLDIGVSVNIAARHLQEPDFSMRLRELLARHEPGLAPHLELEVLEHEAHDDIDAISTLLGTCRGLGVRVALDDFGTGYSTLTTLRRLPVDTLKIDRSFVHQMLDSAQDRGLVEGVIGLAGTFGCQVIAEGVESPAQARLLLDLGCAIGQGTGIAAPMPAAQVAEWVREHRGIFALAPAVTAVRGAAGD